MSQRINLTAGGFTTASAVSLRSTDGENLDGLGIDAGRPCQAGDSTF